MNIYGLSETGLIRKDNQDSIYYDHNQHGEFFAVVCDGIGGGNAGDVASKIASNSLADAFIKKAATTSDKASKEWITQVVKDANDEIFTQSTKSKNFKGMGTTLAGAFVNGDSTYIFHCGDSRIYGLYSELICLTEDHNLAADLIKAGNIPEEEALAHPRGAVLTNALGIWNVVQAEIHKINSDYFELLLCSDGLHGFVSEEKIESILKETTDIKEQAKQFIEASNRAGGFDNVSVILMQKEGEDV